MDWQSASQYPIAAQAMMSPICDRFDPRARTISVISSAPFAPYPHQVTEKQFYNSYCQFHKTALVWSPVAAAAAAAGCHGSTLPTSTGRPHSVSPASPVTPIVTSMATNTAMSGLPWMSVMAEHHHHHHHHALSMGTATHPNFNMWNGGVDIKPCLADLNTKMNTPSDHHNNRSPLQKSVYQDHGSEKREFNYQSGNNIDDRSGPSGGLDSQLHNIYANHGNRNHSTNSGTPSNNTISVAGGGALQTTSINSSSSTIVVPQPVNIKSSLSNPSATISAVAAAAAAAANGTGRKYQCKMCPQIFGSKADLQLHTQIHMREAKPYKCSQCSKAFANSSYLSQHTRIHLGIKPYRCDICQRKFTQLSHLQQHIRTHTGDKPYKCRHPGCNKAFSQLSNLQSHSRCHQTDKPYKCNSCYKCFADEPSLLEHIPKHKESKHLKTHICQFCGKSYTQETYLAKHLQKHAEKMEKRAAQVAAAHPMLSANTPRVAQAPPDSYWPKTSESAIDGGVGHHVRPAHESSACLQGSLPDHHSRLHDSHRQGNELGHTAPPAHIGTTMSYEVVSTPVQLNAAANIRTSSAFTPIQAAMLPISSGSQLPMPGSSRSYFPYEPISVQKNPSQSGELKSTTNSFPNQLISLHQIRNYATMPTNVNSEHPIGIKEKSQ